MEKVHSRCFYALFSFSLPSKQTIIQEAQQDENIWPRRVRTLQIMRKGRKNPGNQHNPCLEDRGTKHHFFSTTEKHLEEIYDFSFEFL